MADFDPPGYRDMTGKPAKLPTLYGSPLTMLKTLGKFSRDEIGAGTGLPYKGTKDELYDDWLRRWAEFELKHPKAYSLFASEVPKDAAERIARGFDMGNRVPGSRGMHKDELEHSFGFDPQPVTSAATGLKYLPTVTPRIGRDVDLNQDLIGPVAGHFGFSAGHAAVPLFVNAHPSTTLVTTDGEANRADELSYKLHDEGKMTDRSRDFVFDGRDEEQQKTRMRHWLIDNGFTALLYPNEVEGSPDSSSDQARLMRNMGARAGVNLKNMPFDARAEAMAHIPNPSLAVLDPTDLKHQMADFLNRKGGYKAAIPLAAGMAGLKYLQGSEAEAGDFSQGNDFLTKAPTGFVGNPRRNESIQPYDVDEWYDKNTDHMDQWLDARSDTAKDVNDAMRGSWWGSGLSETALDVLSIPVDAMSMLKNRVAEQRVEDALAEDSQKTLAAADTMPPEEVEIAKKSLKAIHDRGMKRSYTTKPVGPVRDYFSHDDRSIVSKPAELTGSLIVGEGAVRLGKRGYQAAKGKIKDVYKRNEGRIGRILEIAAEALD